MSSNPNMSNTFGNINDNNNCSGTANVNSMNQTNQYSNQLSSTSVNINKIEGNQNIETSLNKTNIRKILPMNPIGQILSNIGKLNQFNMNNQSNINTNMNTSGIVNFDDNDLDMIESSNVSVNNNDNTCQDINLNNSNQIISRPNFTISFNNNVKIDAS